MYCTDRPGRPPTLRMDATVVSSYVTGAFHMKNKLSSIMLILCVFPPRGLQLCRKANARVKCHSKCFQELFLHHLLFSLLFFLNTHAAKKDPRTKTLYSFPPNQHFSAPIESHICRLCCQKAQMDYICIKWNHVILLPVCSSMFFWWCGCEL